VSVGGLVRAHGAELSATVTRAVSHHKTRFWQDVTRDLPESVELFGFVIQEGMKFDVKNDILKFGYRGMAFAVAATGKSL
jgi:hypothetical protein